MRKYNLIAFVILVSASSYAQKGQVQDGYYILGSFLGDDDVAADKFGNYVHSQDNGAAVAPAGTVLVTLEGDAESKRLKYTGIPKIAKYVGQGFELSTTYSKVAGATVDLKKYGINATVEARYVKEVKLKIDKVSDFVKQVSYSIDKVRFCGSAGGSFTGGYADNSRNYTDAILKCDIIIDLSLDKGLMGQVKIDSLNLNAKGGIETSKGVTLKSPGAWAAVHVINISKNYCKDLKGKPVPAN